MLFPLTCYGGPMLLRAAQYWPSDGSALWPRDGN
jgi:hypothetical protein